MSDEIKTTTPRTPTPGRKSRKGGGQGQKERDYQMLRLAGQCGGVTAKHFETLYFPPAFRRDPQTGEKVPHPHSNCQRRIRILREAGFLRRIERYQLLSEGKRPYVYALTEKGASALARHVGCEIADLDWRRKDPRLTSDEIEHLVKNNDFRVAVTRATVEDPERLSISLWLDSVTLNSRHSKDRLSVTMGSGGVQKGVIVPDDYFILLDTAREPSDWHFFVEIDRGTETVESKNESRRTWERKIRFYLDYYRLYYPQRYSTHKGRVLTITTSQERLENMKKVTEQAGGEQRFWFTTFDMISWDKVLFEPIWRVAKHEGWYPILKK